MKKYLLVLVAVLISANLFAQPDHPDRIRDNKKHFVAGVVISSVTYGSILAYTDNQSYAILGSIGASIAAGYAKEFYDQSQGRIFRPSEAAYTSVGGVTAAFTWTAVLGTKRYNNGFSLDFKLARAEKRTERLLRKQYRSAKRLLRK